MDWGLHAGHSIPVHTDLSESHSLVPLRQLSASVVFAAQRDIGLAQPQSLTECRPQQPLTDSIPAVGLIDPEVGHLDRRSTAIMQRYRSYRSTAACRHNLV